MELKDFFSNLEFDFDKDLESKKIAIAKNFTLSVYSYKNPNQTNTSFHLITTSLSETELEKVRKYFWNKNDADIIFLHEREELKMLYAKCNPQENNIIDSFSITNEEKEKLEKIKRWQFDSGSFWLNYFDFFKKAKFKKIDKDLVATLIRLKNQLNDNLISLISEEEERSEIVQTLIDRTLYVKYLEDNHIINSFFYKHYFKDDSLDYKILLKLGKEQNINKLFEIIHKIFNNNLFDDPQIDGKYLSEGVCNLIAQSFNCSSDGQLRLFDFQFDVLPIEFISYIYEVFLTDEQKKNGIYYTPKKLAQLIVDDVIKEKTGSVLDPSCGSGMFLIIAYQRLLEIEQKKGNEPTENIEKIRFRTQLLCDNIFGVEKQPIAYRLTLFSLSLQIFKDIPPPEIREFIEHEIKHNKEINLFSEYNFYENILCQNTLDIKKIPFKDKKFDYIVGNPPFFKIKDTDEEISFLKKYKLPENEFIKDIVGTHQISQCFLLKIKDWSNDNTRFGFVSNTSSFFNDQSASFQKYFYSNYGIEKIYELSRVKKILFENAKEDVVAIIFNNQFAKNNIEYYPVEMGLFSEKPFELLIIQENKAILIEQEKLIKQEIKLRDYLVGNEYDLELFRKLHSCDFLEKYILKTAENESVSGIRVWGSDAAKKEFSISLKEWGKLKDNERDKLKEKFNDKYFSHINTPPFINEFYRSNKLLKFKLSDADSFFSDKSNFHRLRTENIFKGDKILWKRIGEIKAVFSKEDIYFDYDIYAFKLNDKNLYYLITAILNSQLITYFVDNFFRKRIGGAFPKIGQKELLNIPIPKELDDDLVNQISQISKDLTEDKFNYSEKEKELNELIFDLYDLSYTEKQRIRDCFLPKPNEKTGKTKIDNYKSILVNSINFFLNNPISKNDIEFASSGFNLLVIKVPLNGANADNPTAKKVGQFVLYEFFEQNPNTRILSGQEKIFGKDCVYIIKENINKNWTETKAFEDGKDILKCLITGENGE